MCIIFRIFSTLLLAAIAATASAQTAAPDDISKQLDDQVLNAVDTHTISDRALILALVDAEANADARITDLLSLALERGAITKTTTGTGLTFNTTPYAFWTGFGAEDKPQIWKSADMASRVAEMIRACDWLLNTDSLHTARAEMYNWLQSNRNATAAEIRTHLDAVVGRLKVDQACLKTCITAITTGE